MKKALSFAIAVLFLPLCACTQEPPAYSQIPRELATTSEAQRQNPYAPTFTVPREEVSWKKFVFPPEAITWLYESLEIVGIDFEPSKRYIYYDLPLPKSLLPDGVWDDFNENYYGQPPEPSEMVLVTYIKKYGISKEAFEEIIQEMAVNMLEEGIREDQLYNELFELPNPDIIYTFDNEIIDAYYRRENPVAPTAN